jgi:hypothetical protein
MFTPDVVPQTLDVKHHVAIGLHFVTSVGDGSYSNMYTTLTEMPKEENNFCSNFLFVNKHNNVKRVPP